MLAEMNVLSGKEHRVWGVEIRDAQARFNLNSCSFGILANLLGRAELTAAIESSDDRMHMAYYNLGNKYRELERWDEAIAAYTQSLRLVPGAVSTRNNLAVAYELGGRQDDAIREWRLLAAMARRRGGPGTTHVEATPMERTGHAVWHGAGADGSGHLSTQSGALKDHPHAPFLRRRCGSL